MICPNCRKDIPEGTKFCENCGTPVKKDNADTAEIEEQAVIAEEPAFIAEEIEKTVAAESAAQAAAEAAKPAAANITEIADISDNSVDAILAETPSAHSATAVLDKDGIDNINGIDNKNSLNNKTVEKAQSGQMVNVTELPGRRGKMKIPAAVAVCIAFGLLMTAFSAVSVGLSAVRKTLVRGAVSDYTDNLYVGDIVVGDTDLADEFVDKSRLSKTATVSDVIIVTIEDYEKYILRGMFENNNVTVEDIGNLNVDLNGLVEKIDGIDSVSELDMDTLIENFGKLGKDEIDAIVGRYSDEEFPELTFEIDKRRVEDLLNKSSSPAKSYISDIVKAYENYLLTGEDNKPFTEVKMNSLAQDSVKYILDGMNSSYVSEISDEMAQLVAENRALLNSYNPSSVFGVFGSILPASLSLGTIFLSLGLAAVFAAVAAIITKRPDAAAITLGVSMLISGGAALSVNALPQNLASVTGLDYQIITVTAADIVKNTLAEDFSIMGIRALVLGIVIIAAVIVTKLIIRTVKNKKAGE